MTEQRSETQGLKEVGGPFRGRWNVRECLGPAKREQPAKVVNLVSKEL